MIDRCLKTCIAFAAPEKPFVSHSSQIPTNDTESDTGSSADNEYILFGCASPHLEPFYARIAADARTMTASTALEKRTSCWRGWRVKIKELKGNLTLNDIGGAAIETFYVQCIKYCFPRRPSQTYLFCHTKSLKQPTFILYIINTVKDTRFHNKTFSTSFKEHYPIFQVFFMITKLICSGNKKSGSHKFVLRTSCHHGRVCLP